MSASSSFWDRVDMQPGGCWLWTGTVSSKGGHGIWKDDNRRTIGAHRYSYKLNIGPIPDGMVLLHSCDNPRCVNPKHLTPGTQKQNVADMLQKGRGWKQKKYGKKTKRGGKKSRTPTRLGIPRAAERTLERGPIINLCGPPGAGKSYYLNSLRRELEQFRILRIDDYHNEYHDNRTAWDVLVQDALSETGSVIVESSGLGVSLGDLQKFADQQGRKFKTVIVTAPRKTLLERVSTREARQIKGISFSLEEIIDACLQKLPMKWRGAVQVRSDNLALSVPMFLSAMGCTVGE